MRYNYKHSISKENASYNGTVRPCQRLSIVLRVRVYLDQHRIIHKQIPQDLPLADTRTEDILPVSCLPLNREYGNQVKPDRDLSKASRYGHRQSLLIDHHFTDDLVFYDREFVCHLPRCFVLSYAWTRRLIAFQLLKRSFLKRQLHLGGIHNLSLSEFHGNSFTAV